MKKSVFIGIMLLILSVYNTFGQRNEIGFMAGTSYYLGDLNPSKHFFLTKPAGGLVYRYIINPRWALKLDGLYGSVEGNDAKAKYNVERNLSFKSNLFEASAQLELNFLSYITGNDKINENYFSPYIFGGISLFKFNPRAKLNNTWYDLQPYGTEGQGSSQYPDRKPYALSNIAFPFGLGFKYSLGTSICIGAEWGLRKTTTDYLDDVSTTYADPAVLSAEHGNIGASLADRSLSGGNNTDLQRGNSGTKDWYSFACVFITIKFKTSGKSTCSAYGKHYKFKEYLKKD